VVVVQKVVEVINRKVVEVGVVEVIEVRVGVVVVEVFLTYSVDIHFWFI
jgi:hypothetical protein